MIPLITPYYNTNIYRMEVNDSIVSVNNSVLGLTEVNLDQDDTICLENLENIRIARFENDLDFYICVVKEKEHVFLFEGSRFMEAFLRKKKSLLNPLTNQTIGNFEVLKSTQDNPHFQHFMMQEDVQVYPRYLPILWNDQSRTEEQIGEYYFGMGNCYYKGRVVEKDFDKALGFYKKALGMGNEKPILNICHIIRTLNPENDKKIISNINTAINLHHTRVYLELAQIHYSSNLLKDFSFFNKKAAFLGNFLGVLKTISFYESCQKDRKQDVLWRSVLPNEWQEQSMSSFVKHLEAIKYPWNHTQKLNFPEELLKEKAILDKQDYFEPNKKV